MEEQSLHSTQATIIAALSSLPPPDLRRLTHSVASEFRRHYRSLSALLSSPAHFSLALRHVLSLPIPAKTHLIARHLLSTLCLLTATATATTPLRLQDYDAVLLLLLLCDLRHHHPHALQSSPPSNWRVLLTRYLSASGANATVLSLSGVSVGGAAAALIPCIELVTRCRRLVGSMGKEVAASPAAVVALPSVEVSGGSVECPICREEMGEGRDVCELPCRHLFHWMCILPWVRKRNTCPCCRFRLPTDDVYGEIERLWEVLVKIGGKKMNGE